MNLPITLLWWCYVYTKTLPRTYFPPMFTEHSLWVSSSIRFSFSFKASWPPPPRVDIAFIPIIQIMETETWRETQFRQSLAANKQRRLLFDSRPRPSPLTQCASESGIQGLSEMESGSFPVFCASHLNPCDWRGTEETEGIVFEVNLGLVIALVGPLKARQPFWTSISSWKELKNKYLGGESLMENWAWTSGIPLVVQEHARLKGARLLSCFCSFKVGEIWTHL